MSDADQTNRLDLMILARIAGRPAKSPPTPGEITSSLARYVAPDQSPTERRRSIGERVEDLIASDLLDPSRELTAAGRKWLCEGLGLTEPPSWRAARDRVFPMLSLGLDPASDHDIEAFRRSGFVVAAVVDQLYDLQLKVLTPNRACTALAAQRLGGRPARTASDLGKAAVERWMSGQALGADLDEASASGADGQAPFQPDEPRPTDEQFADALLATLSVPEVARFGTRRVYISSVFRQLQQDDARFAAMSWSEFAERLVEVNRQHRLTLGRADHVAAMDAEEVRRSHIRHRGSDFHFIVDEPPRDRA